MSGKNRLFKSGETIWLLWDFCRSRISAGFGKSARFRPEPKLKSGTALEITDIYRSDYIKFWQNQHIIYDFKAQLVAFSALTLLVGQQRRHPPVKNRVVGC